MVNARVIPNIVPKTVSSLALFFRREDCPPLSSIKWLRVKDEKLALVFPVCLLRK
jgi:hypothetical protein